MLPQSDPTTSTGYLRKIATTFCSTALEAFPGRKYGQLEHLEEMDNPRYWKHLPFWRHTKSGQELEVFLTMPLERLQLGCGTQCTETMLPLGPNQRPRLYARVETRLDVLRRAPSASGRLSNSRRNFLASSVCCSPPGVCLWSPDQISKHVRGVRAIVAASSMLPYC